VGQLLAQLRYEGHPVGWYLLVFPLAKSGLPMLSMRILHALMVLGVVFILCFVLKKHLLLRLILLVSPQMIIEMTVMSRNYVLSALTIVLLMVLIRNFHKYWILIAVCFFFLINSNVYGTVSAIAIGLGEGLRYFLPCNSENRKNEEHFQLKRETLIFSCSICVSFAIFFLTTFSGAFRSFSMYDPIEIPYISGSLTSVFSKFFQLLRNIGLPSSVFGIPLDNKIVLALLVAILAFGLFVSEQSWQTKLYVMSTWTFCIIGTVVVYCVSGVFVMRQSVPFLFALVFFAVREMPLHHQVTISDPPGRTFSIKHSQALNTGMTFALVIFFCNSTVQKIPKVPLGESDLYSTARFTAQALIEQGYDTEDTLIVSDYACYSSSILPYLQSIRTFRYLFGDASFEPWQMSEKTQLLTATYGGTSPNPEAQAAVLAFALDTAQTSEKKQVLLVVNSALSGSRQSPPIAPTHDGFYSEFPLVYSSAQLLDKSGERYDVYRLR
jgi:hypothetical protein